MVAMNKSKSFKEANQLNRSGRHLEAYLIYAKLAYARPEFKYYRINKEECRKRVFRTKPQSTELVKATKDASEINSNNFCNKYMAIDRQKKYDPVINLPAVCRERKIKLLIAKPSGIGNMIMFLPTLRCLLDTINNIDLTVLCNNSDSLALSGYPVTIEVLPIIDAIDKRLANFRSYLNSKHFDIVLYPPYTSLSPPLPSIDDQTIHIQHPQIDFQNRHEAVHNFEILSMLGINATIDQYLMKQEQESRNEILVSTINYFVLHPGSSNSPHMRKKRWPVPHWASLARNLSAIAPVCFIGGHDDKLDVDNIFSLLSSEDTRIFDLTGVFQWTELIELISAATVFISNDSGIMHLASTTNVPIVSIFGPTDPVKNAPFRASNVSVITADNVKCAPCYVGKSRQLWQCEHQICLVNIKPDQIIKEVTKYIPKFMRIYHK
jgi:ADP-heptose:LPS heptosyltransferase